MTALTQTAPSWWPPGIPWPGGPAAVLDEDGVRRLWALYAGREPSAEEIVGHVGLDPVDIENRLRSQRGLAPVTVSSIAPQPTVDLTRVLGELYNQSELRRQQQSLLEANPRNFVQSLLMGGVPSTTGHPPQGGTSQQVGAWLQETPLVRDIFAEVGLSPYQPAALGVGPPPPGGAVGAPIRSGPWSGTNPDFAFVAGRHINTRDMLRANPTRRGIMESLASFSGQDPADWMADWERHRPRGTAPGATRFR